jgi:protein required for attachment to host cells
MDKLWVIVANSSVAFIYKMDKQLQNLDTFKELRHDASRMRSQDLTSDESGAYGQATYQPSTDPKAHEHEIFANSLASELASFNNQNAFQHLVLIAPPHFHGLLEKSLAPALQSKVLVNLQKDYTKMSNKELFTVVKDNTKYKGLTVED